MVLARADNLYSRFVAWVKILLPLAALGLLAALFLLARTPDEAPNLPYARAELAEIARARGIASPHYTGVTADGHALSVTAAHATPKPGDRRQITVADVEMQLETDTGRNLTLIADGGSIDTAVGAAEFEGAVEIATATGHRLLTDRLRATFERTELESAGHVTIFGPGLEGDAGKLVVRGHEGNDGVIAVFTQGVRLVYTPGVE